MSEWELINGGSMALTGYPGWQKKLDNGVTVRIADCGHMWGWGIDYSVNSDVFATLSSLPRDHKLHAIKKMALLFVAADLQRKSMELALAAGENDG